MDYRKCLKAIMWGLLASLMAGCHGGDSAEPIMTSPPVVIEPGKEEQLAKLEAELATVDADIKALIGQAQCASSLDCRMLECIRESTEPVNVGQLALAYYGLPYSVLETDDNQLTEKINQQASALNKLLAIKYPGRNIPATFCTSEAAGYRPRHLSEMAICDDNRCGSMGFSTIPEDPWPFGQAIRVVESSLLKTEIDTMIGDPVCSSSEQCGVWNVTYSSATCGEPTAFAYSAFAADPQQIAKKVGQYAQNVAAEYNAMAIDDVCQQGVAVTAGVCRNEKCEAD